MPQIIDLGRIRFLYRGDWNNSTSYELNDVVRYGGASYVYKSTTPSTGSNPNNDTYWDQMTSGFQYEAGYSASTQYQTNDVVTFGGQSYVATTDTIGNDPTDTNYWNVMVGGLSYSGEWASGTTYYPNDIVNRGPIVYRSNSYHTSSSVFETDRAAGEWTVFIEGTRYRDTWTTNTAYLKNDQVNDNLNLYISTTDHTSGNGLFSQEPAGTWLLVVPGADYLPAQATNESRLLSTDGTNPFWSENIEISGSASIYANPFLNGPSAVFATSLASLNPNASAYLGDYGLDAIPAGLTNPIAFFSFNSSNVANPAVNSEGDYAQFTVQNFSSGESASTDIIANADIGDDETGWIDMGITSTSFYDPDFTITGAHDGYIFMSAPIGTQGDGNLVFATDSTGQTNAIVFAAGGLTSNATQMVITPDQNVRIEIATESTSYEDGALTVAGGAGIAGNLNILGNINAQGSTEILGDMVVQGSITVAGGQFVTENLSSTDPLLFVGNGNETNNFDLGLITEAKQPSNTASAIFGEWSISSSVVTLTTAEYPISIKSRTSDVATLTIGSHSFVAGDKIRVDLTDATFSGDFEITSVTPTTILYNNPGSDVTTVAASGTVQFLIDTAARDFVFTDFMQISGVGSAIVDGYRHIIAVTETSVAFSTDQPNQSAQTISPAAVGVRNTRSKYSGFVKDNFDGKWHLFNDLEVRPTTTIDFYGTPGDFTTPGGYDAIKVGYVESLRGINIFDSATAKDNGIDPIHGTIVYRTDLNVQEVYTGSTWDAIDPIHPFLLMGV